MIQDVDNGEDLQVNGTASHVTNDDAVTDSKFPLSGSPYRRISKISSPLVKMTPEDFAGFRHGVVNSEIV